jgi:hypothetical protein
MCDTPADGCHGNLVSNLVSNLVLNLVVNLVSERARGPTSSPSDESLGCCRVSLWANANGEGIGLFTEHPLD